MKTSAIAACMLPIAIKNMRRHKLRTALTTLGIAVAIVSFGLLRTVVDAWYASAQASASSARLVTRNAISVAVPLPISHADRIAQVAGVAGVSWSNWFGGEYISQRNFFPQFAVDAYTYFDVFPEIKLSDDEKHLFVRDRRGCVVGRKLAQKYGWRVGDQIPLRGVLYPGKWDFVVRGIYTSVDKNGDESSFLFHWDYLNERMKSAFPGRGEYVGVIFVKLKDAAQAARVTAAIDSLFRNSLAETHTETQKAFQLGFVAMIDAILISIQLVAAVVVLIIMAVMANTMAMTARERTPEYATLKAIGFSDTVVIVLILIESMAIALCGGLIGMLLTFPVAHLFGNATDDVFTVFEVTSQTLLMQLSASFLVGFVGALIPAWNSRRVAIVDGLRAIA